MDEVDEGMENFRKDLETSKKNKMGLNNGISAIKTLMNGINVDCTQQKKGCAKLKTCQKKSSKWEHRAERVGKMNKALVVVAY